MSTTRQIHLPDNIDVAADELWSFVLATDPVAARQIKKPVEIPRFDFDQFGFPIRDPVVGLWSEGAPYGISPDNWDIIQADVGASSVGLLPGEESGIWTERVNTRAIYPAGSTAFRFTDSGIETTCNESESDVGLQQVLITSKRVFQVPQSGTLFITIAIRLDGTNNRNAVKTWGAFTTRSGWFFEVRGNGTLDDFAVVRRNTINGVSIDERYPRSSFIDKLDGTGRSGFILNLTNICMYGVQVGSTEGSGAKFYVYVPDNLKQGGTRWVEIASVPYADRSVDRALQQEPLSVVCLNRVQGRSPSKERLTKYGTAIRGTGVSFQSDQQIISVADERAIDARANWTVVSAIRTGADFNAQNNYRRLFPERLSVFSNAPVQLMVVKNPIFQNSGITERWERIPGYNTSIEQDRFNTGNAIIRQVLGDYISGREMVRSFCNGTLELDLRAVFNESREFLSTTYDIPPFPNTARDYTALSRQDRVYILARSPVAAYRDSATTEQSGRWIERVNTSATGESSLQVAIVNTNLIVREE